MSESKFTWSDEALIPDKVAISYPVKFDDAGEVTEKEGVTHYELARPDLVNFIAEAMDKDFIIEVEENGEKIRKRKPFKDIEAEQRKLFFEYLAKSTRGKKDAKFFEKLEIGAKGMDALVEMFFAINHIMEVVGTAGNWLMLPQVRAMLSEAEAGQSDSQKPTMQA